MNSFTLKNSLFGATNIAKYSDKGIEVYRGYVIAFGGLGLWSFGNEFARNVMIFGVDNNSSSHSHNRKNNLLVLGEGPTDDINGSIGAADKKLSINFSKAKTSFFWNLSLEEEVSLKRNVHNVLIDYDAIDECDILNIYKYLMVTNNIR